MRVLPIISRAVVIATAVGLGAQYARADAGHGQTPGIGAPGTESDVSRTIHVTLTENEFSLSELAVTPGETIKFVLTNVGEDLHEFSIATKEMHEAHQQEMMTMMETIKGHAAGMENSMDHDDPNSMFLKPGETKEMIWRFPRSASLEFACNIPGHYESGMVGTIHLGG